MADTSWRCSDLSSRWCSADHHWGIHTACWSMDCVCRWTDRPVVIRSDRSCPRVGNNRCPLALALAPSGHCVLDWCSWPASCLVAAARAHRQRSHLGASLWASRFGDCSRIDLGGAADGLAVAGRSAGAGGNRLWANFANQAGACRRGPVAGSRKQTPLRPRDCEMHRVHAQIDKDRPQDWSEDDDRRPGI